MGIPDLVIELYPIHIIYPSKSNDYKFEAIIGGQLHIDRDIKQICFEPKKMKVQLGLQPSVSVPVCKSIPHVKVHWWVVIARA